MLRTLVFVAAVVATVQGTVYLKEQFTPGWESRWVKSEATKEGAESDIAKYDGVWEVQGRNESAALVATVANKHYGLSTPLSTPFKFDEGKALIVQYEVKYQTSMTCGGSYVKLLSDTPDFDLKQVAGRTPYTIMFGPDKCGGDSHIRFIYRFKNPVSGVHREVHANHIDHANSLLFNDKRTHLVTLIVRPDNTFAIEIDDREIVQGHLAYNSDFNPALQPPKEVADPEDTKPADWVDEQTIVDPDDAKPDDWDETQPAEVEDASAERPAKWQENEPKLIADPTKSQPEDWNEDEDGVWEAPLIENPKCEYGCGPWVRPKIRNPLFKGKWHPRQIPNPAFKGVWAPRQIPNPDYFEEASPFAKLDPIKALGFELWTITPGISFSNIIVTDDEAEAQQMADEFWKPKKFADDEAFPQKGYFDVIKGWYDKFLSAAEQTPYLYVLFTAVVGLPIIIIVRCCMGGGEPQPIRDQSDANVGAGARKDDDAQNQQEDTQTQQADATTESAATTEATGSTEAPADDTARDVDLAPAAKSQTTSEEGAAVAGEEEAAAAGGVRTRSRKSKKTDATEPAAEPKETKAKKAQAVKQEAVEDTAATASEAEPPARVTRSRSKGEEASDEQADEVATAPATPKKQAPKKGKVKASTD